MRLYSNRCQRLYLNPSERVRYQETTFNLSGEQRLLCLVLYYTGCRISEAIGINWSDIQWDEHILAIRSLKKRDEHHIREIPVPEVLVELLAEQYRQYPNQPPLCHEEDGDTADKGENGRNQLEQTLSKEGPYAFYIRGRTGHQLTRLCVIMIAEAQCLDFGE